MQIRSSRSVPRIHRVFTVRWLEVRLPLYVSELHCDSCSRRQDFRPEPVQAGRAQASSEASEKREEESDGSEPFGRRHQAAAEHHQRLRHPCPETSRQVHAD